MYKQIIYLAWLLLARDISQEKSAVEKGSKLAN